ncbi:molybdopterin-dependent oxidoreductase [Ideonella margarita]|uniref:Molybdopterin-dependent oxidoreductase n=1 Tax=Ideonella margarita TaxID=2984191 RepID=A0ABU9CD43_9BURK
MPQAHIADATSANTAANTAAHTTDATHHYRICPLCEACCGLDVEVSSGRIVRIKGAEQDVFSQGYICPKGYALKDLHEDPDRLRQPMVKRNGQHVPVSWEEAFEEIERRLPPLLDEHGRDSVAISLGNPNVHKMGLLLYTPRLIKALGTKNVVSASTLDQMPKQLSSGLMFGHWLSIPVPDIERCDFLLMLGANPMASNGSLWTVPDFRGKAKALRARGGRLVVIDPRRTETAEVADAHHFIRPGTDAQLLAAMVHTLFDEQLVKLGALTDWVNGVEEVRAAVAPFSPEAVAKHCAVPAADIRQLARDLAAAERGCVYGRIGTCTQRFGTLASWLIDVLNVLTGHLDQPGGAMFPRPAAFAANTLGAAGKGRGVVMGRHASRVSGAPEVYGELPATVLAEEIETAGPGQVRALITVASNPVLSAPGSTRLDAALGQLDFMVSVDIYLNETTRHADVILPGSSPLEDGHYDVAFPALSHRNHARYSPPVLARTHGQMPEWQILLKLGAIARGLGAAADPLALDGEHLKADLDKLAGAHAPALLAALGTQAGPERWLDLALRSGPYGDAFGRQPGGLTLAKVAAAPGGVDLGALQPRVPEVLRTPSGRIELAPAPCLADLVLAAEAINTAARTADHTAPDIAKPGRFSLIGRREVRSNNSWMHNLPTLAKGPFRCTLLMHPSDAEKLGAADGQVVRIRLAGHAERRDIEVPVAFSEAMMPGVVSLPHGWGHNLPGTQMQVAAERPGANLNAVLDEALRDPLSGNAVLSGVAVDITVLGTAAVA